MIRGVIIMNDQGKPRLIRFYEFQPPEKQQELVRSIYKILCSKADNVSNFVEADSLFGKDVRLMYKTFATLYFVFIFDHSENELAMIDLMKVFVEKLTKCFKEVCELDIMINFNKVHMILDEIILGDQVETSSKEVENAVDGISRLSKGDDNNGATAFTVPKKKQRISRSNCISSTLVVIDLSDDSPTGRLRKPLLHGTSSHSLSNDSSSSAACDFNDPSTADVILSLRPDHQSSSFDCVDSFPESSLIAAADTQIYLHSRVLCRSKYFATLISDRWQQQSDMSSSMDNVNCRKIHRINHRIPASNDSMDDYLTVLKLLYSDDLLFSIDNLSTALDLLPIALELLFEDCVRACIKLIEAVPWSEDEEKRILSLIPLLSEEESKELLARLSPLKNNSSEEMLHGLILSAIHSHSNMAFAKAFVAKLLRDFSSRETVRKVLDAVFEKSLRVVKQSLEEYSSPDFRGGHDETEVNQRKNLLTAVTNLKHVLWLVERMIELRVADTAVKAWSEQASLTADLRRAFLDDLWRDFNPGLPSVVLRCTCRLANAIATGSILAATQVRMKLVRDWLPVLIICKEGGISIIGSNSMSLYVELEEIFLRIISTLPVSDAQELLQQCLSFSTRNIDDCPHLVDAFTTWFRRANRPPQQDLGESSSVYGHS